MKPTREAALEKYLELESLKKSADFFGITRHAMQCLLRNVDLSAQIAKRRAKHAAKIANFEIIPHGAKCIWKPVASRSGFKGIPEAREPWPVTIKSGPNTSGFYEVTYDGPDLRRRAARTVFKVNGLRLFPEEK